MTLYEIFILALAMAVDCTIVAFSYSLILTKNRIANSILFASAFAFFQGLMPIIGWLITGVIYNKLEIFSKWIIFIIFMFLGSKFIQSAISKGAKIPITCITIKCLLALSVATSIDALGAGISIRFSGTNILISAIIITAVTFIMSIIGFWTANLFKKLPSKPLEIFGAILLFYLAIKALF